MFPERDTLGMIPTPPALTAHPHKTPLQAHASEPRAKRETQRRHRTSGSVFSAKSRIKSQHTHNRFTRSKLLHTGFCRHESHASRYDRIRQCWQALDTFHVQRLAIVSRDPVRSHTELRSAFLQDLVHIAGRREEGSGEGARRCK